MNITRQQIFEGQRIPKGYRIAYQDHALSRFICYPIGIHLIARAARRLWEWSLQYRPSKLEQEMRQIRDQANENFQQRVNAEVNRRFDRAIKMTTDKRNQ